MNEVHRASTELDTVIRSTTELSQSGVLAIGGDLRNVDIIRLFWTEAIELLNEKPHVVWINLKGVRYADTKLIACIVALLRRAEEQGIQLFIVGSNAVQEVMRLCKIPKIKNFTSIRRAA